MVIKKIKKTASIKSAVKKKAVSGKASKMKSIRRASETALSSKSKIKFTLALNGKKSMSSAVQSKTAEKSVQASTLQPRFTFQDNYSLPTNYNTSTLTLIARDPYWIYAYWEIAPSSIEQLRRQIGDQVDHAAYVLRLYEISYVDFNGSNANHYFDMDVGPFANSWYINLWSDNGAYCAEIGLRTPDGKFYKIARSNFMTTPRAGSSHRSDLIWMEVKEEDASAYVELRPKRMVKSHEPKLRIRRIYLSDAEIAAYYSRHFYLLKQILAKRLSPQELEDLHNTIEGIGFNISLDEILQGKFTHRQFLRKIRSGSSEEMVIEEGASVRDVITKRGFFFEIGTELIVYGRTEPDAKVTLEGKDIKLRSDGTFSLRYVLNDTKIPLGFKAYSSNGIDKRSISTAVERIKTVYRNDA